MKQSAVFALVAVERSYYYSSGAMEKTSILAITRAAVIIQKIFDIF